MVDEYEEYTKHVDWDFRPYLPVRPYNTDTNNFVRENVFIHHWQRLMTHHSIEPVVDKAIMREDKWFVENEAWRYPILDVFNNRIPSVHDVRIASNFILFIGVGVGASYLYNAEKLSQKFESVSNGKALAYLSQWAIESNPAENIYYTTPSARFDFAQSNQGDMFFQPKYRDVQTLERMAYWCGTDKGQKFIASCNRTIKNMSKQYYPMETDNRIKRRGQLGGVLRFSVAESLVR